MTLAGCSSFVSAYRVLEHLWEWSENGGTKSGALRRTRRILVGGLPQDRLRPGVSNMRERGLPAMSGSTMLTMLAASWRARGEINVAGLSGNRPAGVAQVHDGRRG